MVVGSRHKHRPSPKLAPRGPCHDAATSLPRASAAARAVAIAGVDVEPGVVGWLEGGWFLVKNMGRLGAASASWGTSLEFLLGEVPCLGRCFVWWPCCRPHFEPPLGHV